MYKVLGIPNTSYSILHTPSNRGGALLTVVFFFAFLSVSVMAGIAAPVSKDFGASANLVYARGSYYTAESGVEDMLYRLKTNKQYSASETLTIDDHEATTTVTTLSGSTKRISSSGEIFNRGRNVELDVLAGVGVSFNYGVQAGQGGFTFSNNAGVNGNVYSNGNIVGANGAYITGSAYAANNTASSPDQSNNTPTPAPNTVTFGNASSTQDIGQGFQVSTTQPVSKVKMYLRKQGNPSNLTVRLTTDNAGKPSTTTLASGTLSASQVTTSFGWVSVNFSSNPTLTAGTNYWIVLDGSNNSSNYYLASANSSYVSGQGKIGQYSGTWNNTTPSGLDFYFELYMGGVIASISSVNVGQAGVGDAAANTVTGSSIAGNLYCQTGSGNNKACNTTQSDPVPQNFPISDANIAQWKDEADDGGTISGYSLVNNATGSLGPKKINGNLILDNNATLTVTGTLWVTGNLTTSNNTLIKLTSGYGSGSGVIVVDGTISISNNAVFAGSGTSGSYLLLLTTSSSTSALNVENNAGTVILYAGNGTANVSNNAGAKEITANQLVLGNNAVITYESGLANVNFVSGPGGAWNITSWKEVE